MKLSGTTKTILIIAGLLAALAAGYLAGGHRHGAPGEGGAAADAKVQYTCGMHPFVIQDEPGICPICNMELTPLKAGTGGQGAAGERKVKHWASPMDPTYVRDEPGQDYMGHDLVAVYEDGGSGSEIVIDPVVVQNMGIRTTAVERRDLRRTVRTVGLVTYAEPLQHSVNSKIDGWIERLYVDQTGQMVKKGAPLLEIYSPELVSAQQEYLLARDHSRATAGSEFPQIAEGGRRLLEAARTRLKYWDVSDRQIAELEASGEVRKTLVLYSPFAGVVTMKKALSGMRVMAGEELLQVSDISRVWVNADLYEYELPWVKAGQSAEVEIPFGVGRTLRGKITYLYPYVEKETRTVKARLEFANPGLALRPDMYANVLIRGEEEKGALSVPVEAVLNSGTRQTVFVVLGEGRFEPRMVQTGLQDDEGNLQILLGLREGEQVVTSAQFMLDSESKLREAIQKMRQPKRDAPATPASGEESLEDLFGEPTQKQADLEALFK